MSTEVVVAVIVALSGGGGLVALYRAWGDRKRGAQDATMQGFKSVIDTLREEVDRLKDDREQDRARIDRIEREVSDERTAKWAAVQHIRVLYAWIMRHIPGVDPPPVPNDLAPYVIIPRKDPES